MASRWRHCVLFDRSEILSLDLPHQQWLNFQYHYVKNLQNDTSNKENDEPSSVSSDGGRIERSSSSTLVVTSPVTSPMSTPRDSDREEKRGRSIARRSTNMKQV